MISLEIVIWGYIYNTFLRLFPQGRLMHVHAYLYMYAHMCVRANQGTVNFIISAVTRDTSLL
jgi:hypothetical protein